MSKNLSRKLAIIEPGSLLVGIDLAQDENVAVAINQQGQHLARFWFPNTRPGYDYHMRRLEELKRKHQAPVVLVGMEPTNYYWKLLAADLEQHQVPYRLVNAYTVKKHREGDQLDRAKDDRRDAFTIADLLRTGKFTETQRLSGPYAELRYFTRLYNQLQQETGRHKTWLRVAVGQSFPELTQLFKSLTGLTVTAMLKRHAAASHIRHISLAEFISRTRADFQGQRMQVSKLRRAHRLALDSVGLDDARGLQVAIGYHLSEVARKQAQLEEVKSYLIDTFLTLPEAHYMLSLGLGLVNTAQILAEIGDPRRYRRAKQLVKLAGIQPSPNISGRKARSATPMSGKGRAVLRTRLYYGCLQLIQNDDAFAQLYQQLQQRPSNPLTKMQALGVLMNKALHILWALISQHAFYDPARLQRH
jgi:transposase